MPPRTKPNWPPRPGELCRAAGHLARYIGSGLGAYYQFTDSDGRLIVDAEKRPIRIYKAMPASASDRVRLDNCGLPTNAQLERTCKENDIPDPTHSNPKNWI